MCRVGRNAAKARIERATRLRAALERILKVPMGCTSGAVRYRIAQEAIDEDECRINEGGTA